MALEAERPILAGYELAEAGKFALVTADGDPVVAPVGHVWNVVLSRGSRRSTIAVAA